MFKTVTVTDGATFFKGRFQLDLGHSRFAIGLFEMIPLLGLAVRELDRHFITKNFKYTEEYVNARYEPLHSSSTEPFRFKLARIYEYDFFRNGSTYPCSTTYQVALSFSGNHPKLKITTNSLSSTSLLGFYGKTKDEKTSSSQFEIKKQLQEIKNRFRTNRKNDLEIVIENMLNYLRCQTQGANR
jgi:hypothetical protein